MTTPPATTELSSTGSAADAVLTITVAADHVVFSGLTNVHRYDTPTAGEIVSYARSVLGENPAWATVHLVATEAMLGKLIEAFGDYEVELTCEISEDGEDSEDSEDNAARVSHAGALPSSAEIETHPATESWEEIGHIPVRRPVLEPRRNERFGRSGYMLTGVVFLVVAVCAVAIWFVTNRGNSTDELAANSSEAANQVGDKAPWPEESIGSDLSEEPPESPETPAPAKVDKVRLEQDGLSVELPVGFHLEPDGDMWRATGPDPNFRLQLAVDPLYGVEPEAVIRQVKKDIEEDPELRHIESDDTTVRYEHDLPDGSKAQWSTWTDRDVQISIGCHTKTMPTTVQLATCTMANESARFSPG